MINSKVNLSIFVQLLLLLNTKTVLYIIFIYSFLISFGLPIPIIGTLVAQSQLFLGAFVFFIVFSEIIFKQKGKLYLNRHLAIFLIYAGWIVLSYLINISLISQTYLWCLIMCNLLATTILVTQVFQKEDVIKCMDAWSYLSTGTAIISIFQFLLQMPDKTATIHDPNIFSRFQVIALVYLLIKIYRSKTIMSFASFQAGLILISIFYQQSRSGFLMLFIALGLFVVHSKNKRFIIASTFVSLILASLMLIPIMNRIRSSHMDEHNASDLGRLHAMITGVSMIKDRPIIGVGHTNSLRLYSEYVDPSVPGLFGMETIHNIYITIFAELGIIGLALFLILNLGLLYSVYRHYLFRKMPSDDYYLALSLIIGITLYLFHGLVYHTFDYVFFYWYLLSFCIILLKDKDSKASGCKDLSSYKVN